MRPEIIFPGCSVHDHGDNDHMVTLVDRSSRLALGKRVLRKSEGSSRRCHTEDVEKYVIIFSMLRFITAVSLGTMLGLQERPVLARPSSNLMAIGNVHQYKYQPTDQAVRGIEIRYAHAHR